MSGPKDYDLVLTVERLATIMQRLNEQRQTRAAQLRAALAQARESTRSQLARERSAQEAVHLQALELGRSRADAIRAEALRRSEEASRTMSARTPSSGTQSDWQADEPATSPEKDMELEEQLRTLVGWKDIIAGDEAIASFCRAEAEAWSKATDNLLSEESTNKASLAVQTLLKEAERIHTEAGELQAKFDTRNEILRDVIDSLKEIGFFVADPEFEVAHDPLGRVLVKAVRGGEEMTAAIDLTKTIRSNWNGLEQEQCHSAFFDYVDRMQAKGVTVKAHRTDLRQRPVLKQQGAQELPRSTKNQRGR